MAARDGNSSTAASGTEPGEATPPVSVTVEPPTAMPTELPTVFSSATVPLLGALTSCRRCTSSSSAGAYPRPFCVSTCTTIGPSHSAAWWKACSMCSMLWPSIGPA